MSIPGSTLFTSIQKTLCESNSRALNSYSSYGPYWVDCDLISANKTNTVCEIQFDLEKMKQAKVEYGSSAFYAVIKSSLQKYAPTEQDTYYYGSISTVAGTFGSAFYSFSNRKKVCPRTYAHNHTDRKLSARKWNRVRDGSIGMNCTSYLDHMQSCDWLCRPCTILIGCSRDLRMGSPAD
ncbi:hypothetical protein FBUS_03206 [Fasciolopsis buskii]|uniref:Uncharacterized protein n=1 Tax=Fasciolopsis buskii TaxID=27845 RepID=A0A8E0RN44_9TREM|nr:hypothetical protein FBUS_03206 [Fasciolopsis buski]